MILFRLLSWPYLRKHRLRWALTVAGIVLGVAVFVAMRAANHTVSAAFSRTVDRIAGATQLQVWAGESGFPEEVLERVQAAPEVRVAVPVIEAVVESGLKGQGNLLLLGVDMTGDRSLRDYDLESGEEAIIDDPLVFLAQPDSLIVTREFAARTGLQIGSRLPLGTMEGPKQFTVRGIMRSGGLTRAFGGNLAIMDIYAAQAVLGRGRRFDRIDLALQEGVTLEKGQAVLKQRLGGGFDVEPPSARGQHFEALTATFSMSLNISSLFALLVGMFIIYNSFAIAVTQRRSEIGILRALGATRAQVRALFLGESAIAGLAGSALGIAGGVLVARAIATYLSRLSEQVFGVAQVIEQTEVDPALVAWAMATGVLTSMVAAWIPARNAARVDPVQALQKGKYQVLSAGENRIRRWAAAALAAVSAGCLLLGRSALVFYAGYAGAVLTALLLAPALALWLARALRPALRWFRPVEGALAADSLIQAPRRTSATVSALMLSLAMVIGFGGVARSVYDSMEEWVRTALNPDLFLTPSADIANRTFVFPVSIAGEVERIEGVREIQLVRSARVRYRGRPVLVVSVEIDRIARTARRPTIAGDADRMYRLAAAGEAAIISDSLSGLCGLRLGEVLELPTPNGLLRLPVAGIVRDHSDPQGSVLIDRSVYRRWWSDDSINVIRLYVKPGVSPAEVTRRIYERFAGQRRLFVLTNRDLRQYIRQLTDQWFGMTYNQIAVAILVAVLGIVNTLIVSITDRRRELGVLQAVGGLRGQVRHTVWLEALSIGAIGLVLGLALGAVNLYYSLESVHRDLGGMRLDYVYPAPIALLLVPVILAAALAAALWPAEAAVRGSLVEALEYE
ncbi:MAG: FtsX-like permease family protein [Acidobacteriota bacterium]